jgi:hypothetical protein
MTIHHTLGVYPNGDRKHNGVVDSHLAEHIAYNLAWRPGRAFFVDGVCHNTGYLGAERCAAIAAELQAHPVVMKQDTAPYQ